MAKYKPKRQPTPGAFGKCKSIPKGYALVTGSKIKVVIDK